MPQPHVTQNVALVVVLTGAIYLTIAAITAIPSLEEPGDSQRELNALRAALAAPDRQFNARAFQAGSPGPFGALEAFHQQYADASAPDSGTRRKYEAVAPELSEAQRLREKILAEHQGYEEWWRNRVLNAQHAVLEKFEASAARKGNYERTEHYVALLRWYDWNLHEAERELNECVRAVEQADGGARRWSAEVIRYLGASEAEPRAPAPKAYVPWDPLIEQCRNGWDFPAMPDRKPLGSRYGAFRLVAQWLVRSESLSLVAVAGLIGFGLLGAATSTIIRERKPHAENTPLVSDLPSVIIRGFTAAIVVFLAVKGGLAIFAVGSPEPNTYVLLLTCFIAAVFSEAVWEGARSYLEGLVKRWGGQQGE